MKRTARMMIVTTATTAMVVVMVVVAQTFHPCLKPVRLT
jgi:hypothetical protein